MSRILILLVLQSAGCIENDCGPDVGDCPDDEYCFSRRPGKYRCKKRPPECGTPCALDDDSDEIKERAAACADALKQCWGDKDHKYECANYDKAPLEVRCR